MYYPSCMLVVYDEVALLLKLHGHVLPQHNNEWDIPKRWLQSRWRKLSVTMFSRQSVMRTTLE